MERFPLEIPTVDSLAGGLARGGLTEILWGALLWPDQPVAFRLLASRTAEAEACALVDGRDGFDPHAAERPAWS